MISSLTQSINHPIVRNAVVIAIPMALSFVVTKVVDVVAHDGFEITANTPASNVVKFFAGVAGLGASVCIISQLKFVPIVNVNGVGQFLAVCLGVGIINGIAQRILPRVAALPVEFILSGILLGEWWRAFQVIHLAFRALDGVVFGLGSTQEEVGRNIGTRMGQWFAA